MVGNSSRILYVFQSESALLTVPLNSAPFNLTIESMLGRGIFVKHFLSSPQKNLSPEKTAKTKSLLFNF